MIKKSKKIIEVKIIESFWSDTDSIKYVGKKGYMIANCKKSPFIDVKLSCLRHFITFHASELSLNIN